MFGTIFRITQPGILEKFNTISVHLNYLHLFSIYFCIVLILFQSLFHVNNIKPFGFPVDSKVLKSISLNVGKVLSFSFSLQLALSKSANIQLGTKWNDMALPPVINFVHIDVKITLTLKT